MQIIKTLIPALFAALAAAAPDSTRHFYTGDPNGEYARLVGFQGSSVLWGYGLSENLPGTIPFYRCRNVGANLYLMTSDPNCEGANGFQLEGNVMFIYANQVEGTNPLDRYFNSQADHLYVRRDWFPDHPGYGHSCDFGYYVKEGTSGYILANAGPNTIPLYMFAQGRHGDRDPCAGNTK